MWEGRRQDTQYFEVTPYFYIKSIDNHVFICIMNIAFCLALLNFEFILLRFFQRVFLMNIGQKLEELRIQKSLTTGRTCGQS